jgi:hypothetical protein
MFWHIKMLSAFVHIKATTKDVIIETKTKKPRKASKKREPKKSLDDGSLEYSTFVPLKQADETIPDAYEDEDVIVGGTVHFEDETKFEDEDDAYKKQDAEWAALMEEIGDDTVDDDTTSEIESLTSIRGDDESTVDIESMAEDDEDDVFFVKSFREQKEQKPAKVYRGPAIFADDDDIP